jgi:hypothetical protein
MRLRDWTFSPPRLAVSRRRLISAMASRWVISFTRLPKFVEFFSSAIFAQSSVSWSWMVVPNMVGTNPIISARLGLFGSVHVCSVHRRNPALNRAHCRNVIRDDSFGPLRLARLHLPRAYALGCILAPLRGYDCLSKQFRIKWRIRSKNRRDRDSSLLKLLRLPNHFQILDKRPAFVFTQFRADHAVA